jgi:hypothetical protein
MNLPDFIKARRRARIKMCNNIAEQALATLVVLPNPVNVPRYRTTWRAIALFEIIGAAMQKRLDTLHDCSMK